MVEGLRAVQSGLSADDKVVVVGLQKIFYPGMPVMPAEVPMGGAPASTAPATVAEK